MKKILLALSIIAAFVFVSCGNNSNAKKQDTHQHEDGSTHEAHSETTPAETPVQEQFEAIPDTTTKQVVKPEAKHDHSEAGHKH